MTETPLLRTKSYRFQLQTLSRCLLPVRKNDTTKKEGKKISFLSKIVDEAVSKALIEDRAHAFMGQRSKIVARLVSYMFYQ